MSGKTEEITKIRDYLLGKNLSEEEKSSIEQQLMISDDYLQTLLITEDELIEEYLDNQLNFAERKGFEERFLISAERREKINFERLLRKHIFEKNVLELSEGKPKEIDRKTVLSFWRRWFLSPAMIAAGVLAVLVTAALIIFYPKNDQIVISLNKAYAVARPFESRITSLEYAPVNNLRGNAEEKTNSTSRKLAENLSLEAVERSKSANTLHNLGRVQLAGKQFDDAITQLRHAKSLDLQNAQILSDLGTALFEKSKSISQSSKETSLELAGQAMEEFEKALQINPNLQEAQFNKALYLQSSRLRSEAKEAWQSYLKLDSNSKWADEARKNLEEVNSQKSKNETQGSDVEEFIIAYRNSQEEKGRKILNQNREMISGKLLPQQLAVLSLEKQETERTEYLAALQFAGKLEKESFNDSFFYEVGVFYASLSPQNLELLKEAQNSVKAGYQFSKENKYQPALTEFLRAREIFVKSGDVWEEKLSDYWIGYLSYQLGKNEESINKFEELARFCDSKKYSWLASAVYSRLSVNALTSKKYSKALEYNKKALNLAEARADLYQQQKSFVQLAEMYQILKQSPEAFRNIENAFRLLETPEFSARQKLRTCLSAAPIFYEKKMYVAASYLLKEALKLNIEVQDKTYEQYAYLLLSKIYGEAGEKEKAFEHAQKSLEVAKQITASNANFRVEADSLVQLADLKRMAGDCSEALKDYDKSVEIYEAGNFSEKHYVAKKKRLNCYFENKNDETISQEIKSVIDIFESNRNAILEEQNRNSFFDNEQNIYDLAIEYKFSKGESEKAFDFAENSRSRSLLDIQQNGAKLMLDNNQPQIIFDEKDVSKPLLTNEIRSQLTPSVQLVEYSVLRDKVLMWLVTKDSFEVFSYKISNDELEDKINNFLQKIEQKKGEEKVQAGELYEILFQPFEEKLDKDKSIYLIPDKSLFRLPFNALFSTKTDSFLVADYKLLLSPSANVFLKSSENARKFSSDKTEKLLSVGNPKFDQSVSPNLPNLFSAEREAREIANFYPNSEILIGEQATKENFKSKLFGSNIVHFAGHYITSEMSPLLSSFLVAGNGEESRLTNYELLAQRFDKTKLIILAACETGAENYFKGEGAVGAGRLFLASGVPIVVASQWKIDSDATTELMKNFHRFRKTQGLNTASALQKAQAEMLNSEKEEFRQPFYWAAFSAIGGYTDF